MKLDNTDLLRTQLFIDGAWIDARAGGHVDVDDPASGKRVAHVSDGGEADVQAAIEAAGRALPGWRGLSARERADILMDWYRLLLEHKQDLAAIMTAEQGKPLKEASGEIDYGANYIRWFAEEARRVYGEVIPAPSGDRRLITLRQPVGVVAAITPWNFPNAMLARKLAPALAAGCTVVCKPATQTPLSALAMVELAQRAGLPKGVVNVVVGRDASAIGKALTDSPVVRKLSFTGSTSVGKRLMAACAGTVKKLSLELGGNAPFIVFDDADLELAVDALMAAKFRNAGQTCICPNRVLVHESIQERFVDAVCERVRQLEVGPGDRDGVVVGPLINDEAIEKVEELLADATNHGARVVVGGGRMEALGPRFFQPTVITGLTREMRMSCDEIFGPVVAVMPFASEEEAIEIANDTEYGLAAYFCSQSQSRCWRVAEALEAGIIGINEGRVSTEVAPFGGVKESGIGREGARAGIDEYLETKYLCLGGLDRQD